jgi:single-strand DNA-binding protein
MAQAAQITFAGNLAADPELRYTPSGAAVATLNVAVGERRLISATGKWEDAGTSWYRVAVWNQPAELVAESLRRGMRVIVTGIMRQREYTDREGEKRYTWDVTADEIGLSLKFTAATPKGNGRGRDDERNPDTWTTNGPRPASDQAAAPASEPPTEPAADGATANATGSRRRPAGKGRAPATDPVPAT